jgi:hypothetical protein
MKLTRATRFAALSSALLSMLFMQLAAAAYACSNFASDPMPTSAMAAMGDCDSGMSTNDTHGSSQLPLCHFHCTAGESSFDKAGSSHLPPLVTAALFSVSPTLVTIRFTTVAPAVSPELIRTIGPPHAIRHCCFRI